MTYELEEASRLKVTGYINNTNLLEMTTIDDVIEGESIIKEATNITGIPLVATTIMENLATSENVSSLKSPEIIALRRTISYDY